MKISANNNSNNKSRHNYILNYKHQLNIDINNKYNLTQEMYKLHNLKYNIVININRKMIDFNLAKISCKIIMNIIKNFKILLLLIQFSNNNYNKITNFNN